jgi:hypothetical protein
MRRKKISCVSDFRFHVLFKGEEEHTALCIDSLYSRKESNYIVRRLTCRSLNFRLAEFVSADAKTAVWRVLVSNFLKCATAEFGAVSMVVFPSQIWPANKTKQQYNTRRCKRRRPIKSLQ